MCLATAGPVHAATITVNSTADAVADDGDCVLREAITAANDNAASGPTGGECDAGDAAPGDVIEFEIAGAGQQLISPASALPEIGAAATLDGATDPSGDEIRLDGASAGPAAGIDVEADDVTVTGLTITRFTTGIDLAGTDGVTVTNSLIGTDQAGTAGLGNISNGIRVGVGTAPATGAEIRNNVISGNGSEAILIADAGSSGNVVAGNRIGTMPAGGAALPNGAGIEIRDGADANTIGGPLAADGNLIAGNTQTAIRIVSAGGRSVDTAIMRNRIGTNLVGEAPLPNGSHGIALDGAVDSTTIRENLISGNTGNGIRITESVSQGLGEDGPSDNVIADNLIGTDKDGDTALGNVEAGVLLSASERPSRDNSIGGTAGLAPGGPCAGDCNVVGASSAAFTAGIEIVGDEVVDTQILGNHVGVDEAGTAALGNAEEGISVGSTSGTTIGSPAAPNVVSGNFADGIAISGAAATGNTVRSNVLGLTADGTAPLGNNHGVRIAGGATGNVIGGSAVNEGNTIAGNSGDGINASGPGNAFLGNSIYDNGGESGLGIDLGVNGVSDNDGPGETDGLQNFPELRVALADGSTLVAGTLESAPETMFRVEFFSSPAADPSGNGEGETPLGSFDVSTDGAGLAAFGSSVPAAVGPGDVVTATATELGGSGVPLSTSEFSDAIAQGCDVTGTAAAETLTGTSADEVICGLGGDDVIAPGGGDDLIVGGDGADRLDLSAAASGAQLDLEAEIATVGADQLQVLDVEDATGTAFADTLTGDPGINVLDGGAGNDTLTGNGAADTLEGGDGADTLAGGDGGDTLKGQGGGDTLKGGDGKDTLKGDAGKDTLKGQGASDTLKGGDAKDTLKGGDGKDTLKGQDGGDKLRGNNGADTLKGGGGSDDLKGGSGKDSLNGGKGGKDVCNGDGGSDKSSAPGCETKRSIP